MKVHLLAGWQPDYLQDIVFHGLTRLLGGENVFEYPPLDRYHEPSPPAEAAHPTWYFDVPSREEVPLEDLAAEADACVLGSVRPGVVPFVRRLLDLRTGRPTAFLDGEDDPYVRAVVREVDVYCKRETRLRAWPLRARMAPRRLLGSTAGDTRLDRLGEWIGVARRGTGVVPLPLGIVDVGFAPAREKRYDVCFLSALDNRHRAAVERSLDSLAADGYRVCLADRARRERLPWGAYMRLLSESRLGISVRGLGYDTYRYWEIPYAGTVLLAEPARIVVPNDFRDGVEAVFAPAARMADVARRLLSLDLDELAERGRMKLLREHTSVHRAQAVLDALSVGRAGTARRPGARGTTPRRARSG